MTLNIVITGVGGQGILSLARAIGEAVLRSTDYNVSIAETHGLSQRGGSVITHVRIGKGILAPTIDLGSADIMLAMELIEASRYSNYLRFKESIAVVNDKVIRPAIPRIKVPKKEVLINNLKNNTLKLYILKASDEALKRGLALSANMMLYGFITAVLEGLNLVVSDVALKIASNLSTNPKINRVNRELYLLGYNKGVKEVTTEVFTLLKKKI